MGRKQRIDFTTPEILIEVEEKIRDGWDEQQVAKNFGYSVGRFSEIKNAKVNGAFPPLYEAIKRGHRPLNFQVENSLYKRAMGLRVKTITKRWLETPCGCGGDKECQYCGGSGKITTTTQIVQEVESELPPDTGAAMAWLKQRKPDTWNKEPIRLDTTTNGKSVNREPLTIEIIDRTDQVRKDDTANN